MVDLDVSSIRVFNVAAITLDLVFERGVPYAVNALHVARRSMGALAVHHLSFRIHALTSKSGEVGRDDASHVELRRSLIAAYRELGEKAKQIGDKKAQHLQETNGDAT